MLPFYHLFQCSGSIAGIVGAGGNTGAVMFGLCFRQLDYYQAFIIMGAIIMGSSVLSVFVSIKGYSKLLWGKDSPVDKNTGLVLTVPEKGVETTEDDEITV